MRTKNKYNFTSPVDYNITQEIVQNYTSSVYNITTSSITIENDDSIEIDVSASISISGSLYYKNFGELSEFYNLSPVVNIRDVKSIDSSIYGKSLVGTSSLWDLNTPIFYISTPENLYDGIEGGYFPIGKIYRGLLPPSYSYETYGNTLTDIPFYSDYEKTLYTLRPEGNDNLDLTGNIYKRNISPSNISSSGFVSASNLYITGASFQYYITSSHVTVGNLIPYYAVFADVTSSLISGNLKYSGSALILDGGTFNIINSTLNLTNTTLSSTNVTNNYTNNTFNYNNSTIVYSSSSLNLTNNTTFIVPSGSKMIISGTLLVNNIQSISNTSYVIYTGSFMGDGSGLYNIKIGMIVSASGLSETSGELMLTGDALRFKTNISSGLDVSFSDVNNEVYIGAFDATYTRKGVSYYDSQSFDVKAGYVKLLTSSLSMRFDLGTSMSGSGLTSIKIGGTGSFNTIQDIRVTATPTFSQLTLTSQATTGSNAVRADRTLSVVTFPQQLDVSSNGSSYSDLSTVDLTSNRTFYLKLEDDVYVSGSVSSKTGSFQYVTGSFYGDGTNLLNVPSKLVISASGLSDSNALLVIPSQSLSIYANTTTGINVNYTNSRLEFNNISSSYSELGVSYYDSNSFIVTQGFVSLNTGSLRNSIRIDTGSSITATGLNSILLGGTGSLNTVQDIRTTATPTFYQLNLDNAATGSYNAVRGDRTTTVYVQPNQLEISDAGNYGGTFSNVYSYTLTADRAYSIRLSDNVQISGSLTVATASISNLTVNNSTTIGGNLIVSGNFSVLGTSSIVDYTTINNSGSIIILNSTSSLINGGIKIYDGSGTPTTGSLIYDVTNHIWKAGIDGSEKRIVLQSGIEPLTPYAIVYADLSGSLTSSIAPTLNVDYTIPSWNGAFWGVTNVVNGGFFGVSTGSLHIRLKHSNSGSVRPSTSDLRRAELAYNTILGKLWILKENGASTVEEIFVTNSGTTGSLYLSGSGHNITGVWSQTGSLYLSNLTGSGVDILTIDANTLVSRNPVTSLTSSFDTIYYKQGGNTFTPSGTLGLLGNVDLSIITNDVEKLRIKNNGNFLFNTTNELGTLTIKSPTGSLSTKIYLQSVDENTSITYRNSSNDDIYKIHQTGSYIISHEAYDDIYFNSPYGVQIFHTGSGAELSRATGMVLYAQETRWSQIGFNSDVAKSDSGIFINWPIMWNMGANSDGNFTLSSHKFNKYFHIYTTPSLAGTNDRTEVILGTKLASDLASDVEAVVLYNHNTAGFKIKNYNSDWNLFTYDTTSNIISVGESDISKFYIRTGDTYLTELTGTITDYVGIESNGKLVRLPTGSVFTTGSIDGVFHKQGGNSYGEGFVLGALDNHIVEVVANENSLVASLGTGSMDFATDIFKIHTFNGSPTNPIKVIAYPTSNITTANAIVAQFELGNSGSATIFRTYNINSSQGGLRIFVPFIGGSTLLADLSTNASSLNSPLFVTGTIRASNDITAYSSSDIRLKDNISIISSPLDNINKIDGIRFNWNDKQSIYDVNSTDYGVIAQQIEEIMPEIVTTRDNGYKAVRYEKIIPLLIESIKELSNKVKILEEQNASIIRPDKYK